MHTRFLLWAFGLLLLALGVFFLMATQTVYSELVQEAKQRSEQELGTLRWLIAHHDNFESEYAFDQWVTNVGSRLGTRISFISKGRVLADSLVPYAELGFLEDHSTRPEVLAATSTVAAVSTRYSATLAKDMIYAALYLPAVAGLPEGVVRVAVPVSDITGRMSSLRKNFLLFLGVVFSLSALLVFIMSKALSRSIYAFADMAEDIGAGNYARRIRGVPGKEFVPLATAINSMAKRIEGHIATIEDQQGRLEAMFEGLSEGVLVLDSLGRIESCNRAMWRMYPDIMSYVGRTPLEATMNLSIQDAVQSILDSPNCEAVRLEVEMEQEQYFAMSAVPFSDREDIRKIVLVFRDVTESRKNDRMLRDFVTNASHQLRTPLTSIKGYAETLLATPPREPEKMQEFLIYLLLCIERNANHMGDVVSSLLALAKSEQLKGLKSRTVDACAVLRQAITDLTPRAASKKMSIKADFLENSVFVHADAEGLLHVLHNLLDNAVNIWP